MVTPHATNPSNSNRSALTSRCHMHVQLAYMLISHVLQEEAVIAIKLLQNLTKRDPPRFPCGQLNPKPLKACRVRRQSVMPPFADTCL